MATYIGFNTTLNNNVLNAYEKVYAKSQTIEEQDFFKNIGNDDAIKDKDKNLIKNGGMNCA